LAACFAVEREVGDGKVFMLLRADARESRSEFGVSDEVAQ